MTILMSFSYSPGGSLFIHYFFIILFDHSYFCITAFTSITRSLWSSFPDFSRWLFQTLPNWLSQLSSPLHSLQAKQNCQINHLLVTLQGRDSFHNSLLLAVNGQNHWCSATWHQPNQNTPHYLLLPFPFRSISKTWISCFYLCWFLHVSPFYFSANFVMGWNSTDSSNVVYSITFLCH